MLAASPPCKSCRLAPATSTWLSVYLKITHDTLIKAPVTSSIILPLYHCHSWISVHCVLEMLSSHGLPLSALPSTPPGLVKYVLHFICLPFSHTKALSPIFACYWSYLCFSAYFLGHLSFELKRFFLTSSNSYMKYIGDAFFHRQEISCTFLIYPSRWKSQEGRGYHCSFLSVLYSQ